MPQKKEGREGGRKEEEREGKRPGPSTFAFNSRRVLDIIKLEGMMDKRLELRSELTVYPGHLPWRAGFSRSCGRCWALLPALLALRPLFLLPHLHNDQGMQRVCQAPDTGAEETKWLRCHFST